MDSLTQDDFIGLMRRDDRVFVRVLVNSRWLNLFEDSRRAPIVRIEVWTRFDDEARRLYGGIIYEASHMDRLRFDAGRQIHFEEHNGPVSAAQSALERWGQESPAWVKPGLERSVVRKGLRSLPDLDEFSEVSISHPVVLTHLVRFRVVLDAEQDWRMQYDRDNRELIRTCGSVCNKLGGLIDGPIRALRI